MRRTAIAFSTLFVFFALAAPNLSAQSPKGEAKAPHKLVGTWKLVSAKYGGKEFPFPEGTTMVKHVTPTQFFWATYDKDGTVSRCAGGPYKVTDETYEETPEYGMGADFEAIKGQSHPFTWKVEGKKWHHDGKLANGLTIDEVWERVETK